jgi:hypothetical protein
MIVTKTVSIKMDQSYIKTLYVVCSNIGCVSVFLYARLVLFRSVYTELPDDYLYEDRSM